MTDKKRRQSVPDRARKRAIRAYASNAGVPYSIAARQFDSAAGPELPANGGRTVYPNGSDEHRRWLIARREHRSYDVRVLDTRQAVVLPVRRAAHLVERFPSTRGEPGTPVGGLYHGESRHTALAMLYATVAHERPHLLPAAGELAWTAELGEEAAVDIMYAGVDRAARRLLDHDRWTMWTHIETALTKGRQSHDPVVRESARILGVELLVLSLGSSVDGARHTLDALLIAGANGHAPGTRVRILARPHRGHTATIVGARWASTGPPIDYEVCPDAQPGTLVIAPDDLTLLHATKEPASITT
jgi:hypothetical protein